MRKGGDRTGRMGSARCRWSGVRRLAFAAGLAAVAGWVGCWGRLCPAITCPAGLALGLAVEVVDFVHREGQPVDLGPVAVLVVVVAHPPDDVHVRALAQVLGRVLGLLGPQRPLDGGGFFGPLFATAPAAVADGGQHRLGDLAFAPVDEFELDGTGQVRVTLDDLNIGHGETPCKSDQPDPDPGSSKPILLLGLPRSRPRAGGGWAWALPSGRGGGWAFPLQHETVSQSPGPPLKDPPTSPPHLWMGAPWGEWGGSDGARAARTSSGDQRSAGGRGNRAAAPLRTA